MNSLDFMNNEADDEWCNFRDKIYARHKKARLAGFFIAITDSQACLYSRHTTISCRLCNGSRDTLT